MMEKWLGFVLFLLSFQQMISGQCFLNIELVQFQNMYQVEIRPSWLSNNEICCCDDSTCEDSLDDFTPTTCSPGCDTYFVLTSEDCQDIVPCPVTMQTDHIVDSPDTTNVSHKFFFDFNNSTTDPVDFEIMMRDVAGSSYNEIDEFNFMVPFPLGNQEEVLFGTRGIGTITLRYDIICIEPNSCSVSLPSEGTALVGTSSSDTSALTSDSTCVSTSTSTTTSTLVTNTTTTVEMTTTSTETVFSTNVINSTTVSTSTATATETSIETSVIIATSTLTESTSTTITITSTVMRSVSSDAMTIAATTRTTTVTRTVLMNPSPEQVSEQQSSTASDSMAVIWMSLFILFLLSTIVAVFIIVYLTCILKRKKGNSKDTSRADNVTLVQTNSLPPMTNPAYMYGPSGKSAANPVYFSVNNEMYDETVAPMHYDYPKRGPDDIPENGDYSYVRTKKLDENGDGHYETNKTFSI